VGAAGGEDAAEHRRQDQAEGGESLGGDEHAAEGCCQEEGEDAGFHEGEVVGDELAGAAGVGCAEGGQTGGGEGRGAAAVDGGAGSCRGGGHLEDGFGGDSAGRVEGWAAPGDGRPFGLGGAAGDDGDAEHDGPEEGGGRQVGGGKPGGAVADDVGGA